MGILADWEIANLSRHKEMIAPFSEHLVNKVDDKKILSYGLGSYGYDIRLSPEQCLLFGGTQRGDCDPKSFEAMGLALTDTTFVYRLNSAFFLVVPNEVIVIPKVLTLKS